MKLLNLTLRVTVMVCLSTYLHAQSSINGFVTDDQDQPLEYANVILYSAQDSIMVKGEVSDERGRYELAHVPAGKYWLSVSFVGLPTYDGDEFAVSEDEVKHVETIRLDQAANNLDEVVVTAEKPLIEVKPDKMVFNVEGSINATGNDAMELLRKSPGVVIDNNDNIMLLGKSGVRVYIDGKPSPLSASDLAEYLRTVQSEQVELIEIITNPSSKYDAEGNAGIINIKFKRDKSLGMNGNVSAGFQAGLRQRYNGSVNLNYRNKNFNTFGQFGLYDGANLEEMNLYREQLGGRFDQRSDNGGSWRGFNYRLGTDYFINKKNTVGFLIHGNANEHVWNSDSRTEIGTIGSNGFDQLLLAGTEQKGNRLNSNINVNYVYNNGEGVTLNVDADYGRYDNKESAYQPNYYFDQTGSELLEEKIYELNTPTDINIYTFKIDHERPVLGGKMGVGIKAALVETDNTFDFYNMFDGEKVLDVNRSNNFVYTENVNAAYASYSKKGEKLGVNIGLRVEQTNSEGELTALKSTQNENVKRSYLDFFPSGGLSYQLNQKHSFQLNYSRRIQRPNYQDLNPFEDRLDELTFQKGNPFLNPQYAHNLQLTHSFNYRFNTSISFSTTKDLISRIVDIQGEDATFITWLNLANQKNVSLSFSAPITVTKWYSVFTNMSGYYTQNEADFGDGKIVDLNATAFNIYQQHTINLPKDFKLELSGWYNSKSIWEGSFIMNPMGSLDIGVQKRILNNKGNLKVSYSDVLGTNRWGGTSNFGELFMDISGRNDTQRIRLNFTYQFGNEQVKRSRRRSTGLEDESRRIKTGG